MHAVALRIYVVSQSSGKNDKRMLHLQDKGGHFTVRNVRVTVSCAKN